MNDFTHYYGKHKREISHVAQIEENNVAQKYPTIRARVSQEMYSQILETQKEKNKTVSEMTRMLWEDYLKKKREKERQEDVEHFLKNANTKIYKIAQGLT